MMMMKMMMMMMLHTAGRRTEKKALSNEENTKQHVHVLGTKGTTNLHFCQARQVAALSNNRKKGCK